jgi:hypothetical protein
MQHKITLAPLVVEEPHLNWLAAKPNHGEQDVQAAELKSGCGNWDLSQGSHQLSNQFHPSHTYEASCNI